MNLKNKFLLIVILLAMVACGGNDNNDDGFYIDNGDGTIKCPSTQLIWQKNHYPGINGKELTGNDINVNWHDAEEYCENLVLGGLDNWFLPSKEELQELLHCSEGKPIPFRDSDKCNKGSSTPAINSVFQLADSAVSTFWTSDTSFHKNTRYVVSFTDGTTSSGIVSDELLNTARCRASLASPSESEKEIKRAYEDSKPLLVRVKARLSSAVNSFSTYNSLKHLPGFQEHVVDSYLRAVDVYMEFFELEANDPEALKIEIEAYGRIYWEEDRKCIEEWENKSEEIANLIGTF